MQNLVAFWNAKDSNKMLLVVGVLGILGCGCCVMFFAVSAALPKSAPTPTLIIFPTSAPVVLDTPTNTAIPTEAASVTFAPSETATPTSTPTSTATAKTTETEVPTSTVRPTATDKATETSPATTAPLAPTNAPSGNDNGPCSCSGKDLDCSDFATHAAAQACYDYCKAVTGGDVHKLDGSDNDGLACENLP